jgi:hypothetical protein
MDHKLAIVIVPKGTPDPVAVSRALLDRFQRPQVGESSTDFEPRFRYKRVGGWFDGLVNGQVGQERWSTVLRMLLDGKATNAASPFPGFGPETVAQIERRIEDDNVVDLDDIWFPAPCSIIVTPDSGWVAHGAPDHFDDAGCGDDFCLSWLMRKRNVFWEHRGAIAVAWDLSWHFIGVPPIKPPSKPRTRTWGSRASSRSGSRESWTVRIASARSSLTKAGEGLKLSDDDAARARWTGDGRILSGAKTLRLTRVGRT